MMHYTFELFHNFHFIIESALLYINYHPLVMVHNCSHQWHRGGSVGSLWQEQFQDFRHNTQVFNCYCWRIFGLKSAQWMAKQLEMPTTNKMITTLCENLGRDKAFFSSSSLVLTNLHIFLKRDARKNKHMPFGIYDEQMTKTKIFDSK